MCWWLSDVNLLQVLQTLYGLWLSWIFVKMGLENNSSLFFEEIEEHQIMNEHCLSVARFVGSLSGQVYPESLLLKELIIKR